MYLLATWVQSSGRQTRYRGATDVLKKSEQPGHPCRRTRREPGATPLFATQRGNGQGSEHGRWLWQRRCHQSGAVLMGEDEDRGDVFEIQIIIKEVGWDSLQRPMGLVLIHQPRSNQPFPPSTIYLVPSTNAHPKSNVDFVDGTTLPN